MNYIKNKKCRISGSKNLINILDLGSQPLANSLKKNANDTEVKYPLSISFCPDSSLLQLNETIERKILFNRYVWVTGTSATAKKYANIFYQRIVNVSEVEKNDFIIEIASNDGTFLKPFLKNGYRNIIGVDPAENITEIANRNGVKTLKEYWGFDISKKIVSEYGGAKIVIARNVIPHVRELHDVIAGIENTLNYDGVGIIEFHNVSAILKDLQYDSIYHEHLCYFSIKSISYLLNRFNLIPFHIDKSPISGGSWVIYFSKNNNRNKTKELIQHTAKEQKNQLNNIKTWIRFAEKSKEHKKKTLDILSTLENKKIIGFGSSARSQTYLNFCGIDSSNIKAIIDNNPLKQGLYAPGSSIPIISFQEGIKMKPDIIFILAWNFKDEIMKECINNGYTKEFLIPFPNKPYFTRGDI